MVDVVRETERKYEATAGAGPDGLAGPPDLPDLAVKTVHTVRDQGTIRLDATYYDTADGRLAGDGITLRRRTGGPDEGWHLKLPVGPGERDEFRAPLDDRLPRALSSLVRSRVRDEPLEPVMRLLSERHLHHLRDADDALLAEVAVDRVRAERLPGGAPAAWTEVETELGEAAQADAARGTKLLDRLEKRLTAAGLRRASTASKLARALAETAPPGAADADAAAEATRGAGAGDGTAGDLAPDTAGHHVLRYVRTQRDALVTLDPAVRRDLPDSVHRMRVATRRLRSCFRSYRTVLDRTATDPLAAELRWLAAELGHDRDREVLTARLFTHAGELPAGLRLGPVRSRLRTFTRARRTGSRGRLTAVLDGHRYLALLDALDALLADPPLRKGAAQPAGKVLVRTVRRDTDRLGTRVEHALATPPGTARDQALHEARKAAKRARYAAEAARPALGKTARQHAQLLTSVQDLLGEHQDSVVARGALEEIARQAHAAGEPSFTFGVLHAREGARAAECERELPDLWEAVIAGARTAGF